jgi:hypothetical protein
MANGTRSNLRIADLKRRQPTSRRLINVKIPAHQADAIAQLADQLGTSKTEVIVALLNTGLEKTGMLKRWYHGAHGIWRWAMRSLLRVRLVLGSGYCVLYDAHTGMSR